MQQDPQAEVRSYSARRMKQAWRSLGISTLLLMIGAMTYAELRSDEVQGAQRDAYVLLLWLFIGRFAWSAWKYLCARRHVTAIRHGIERQLKLTGTLKD
jgi:hypothetical protein